MPGKTIRLPKVLCPTVDRLTVNPWGSAVPVSKAFGLRIGGAVAGPQQTGLFEGSDPAPMSPSLFFSCTIPAYGKDKFFSTLNDCKQAF